MGSAVIFAGTKVKTLKSTLNLNGLSDVISSTTDPTSVAVSAEPGSLLLNSSNGQLYRKNDSGSSTNWTALGAGGQAGINYITNPDALTNTTGWATYADAAGAQPVDGTGGSPSITFTRSTTTPLRGAADFNFSKDAVNRQGQGVATDFIIDLADQARVLSVSFNYEVLSGTYADGDLTVYLIADPAGTPVVIQPAGYTVMSATTGTKMQLKATFQTQATGQTYRLCLHVASTSASAYSLAIDNVTVGPQVSLTAPVMSDWQSYTPSWTALTSNPAIGNGTISGKWRREGDSGYYQIQVTTGSTTTYGSGTYLFSLPSGQTIDYLKTSFSTAGDDSLIPGSARILKSATDRWEGMTVNYAGAGNNAVGVALWQTTSAGINPVNISGNGAFSATVPAVFSGAGNVFTLEFGPVPIAGWSSNAVSSADTDTRVISFEQPNANTGTTYANGTATDVAWTANPAIDTAGGYSSGIYTVPISGYFRISAYWSFNSVTYGIGAQHSVVLTKADNTYVIDQPFFAGAASTSKLAGQWTDVVYFTAGTQLKLRVFQGTGTTATLNLCKWTMERLSGPAVVQATESVAAIYYSTAGNSVANSVDPVYLDFPTKIKDTHNAVSNAGGGNKTTQTGAWVFTAPISGTYLMTASCGIVFPGSTAVDMFIEGYTVSGTFGASRTNYITASVGEVRTMTTNSLYSLNAGDKLWIGVYQSSGLARNQNSEQRFNTVSIVRVGN